MAGYEGSRAKEAGTITYEPSDTGQLSEASQRKYDLFFRNLCKYRDNLAANLKPRMPDGHLRELALSLLDDTVFDIVQELEDIQSLSERQLLNKRMKVIGRHKTMKLDMTKRHKEEVNRCKHKPHTLPLLKVDHSREKEVLEKQLAEEVTATDQEIIMELDQLVSNQQSTLYQAAVPFFAVTNNAQDIQLQIHVLRFIQKLSQLKDAEGLDA